jgi:hypothetical protein
LPGDRFCPWHSPAWADRRREWSAQGGTNRSNKRRAKKALPAEPLTAAEIHSYLGLVFRGVIGGKLEPGVATAAANVARAMIAVRESSELEDRLDALEAAAGIGERRHG